jgi:hypothetical protein
MEFVVVMLVVGLLLMVAGGGFLICWILVLRRIFEHEGINAGVLSILFPPFAWYQGCKKAAEWKLRAVMVFWTVLWFPVLLVFVILLARFLEKMSGL